MIILDILKQIIELQQNDGFMEWNSVDNQWSPRDWSSSQNQPREWVPPSPPDTSRPSYETARPSYETARPSYDSRPSYETSRPSYEESRPSYDTYEATRDESRPSYESYDAREASRPSYETYGLSARPDVPAPRPPPSPGLNFAVYDPVTRQRTTAFDRNCTAPGCCVPKCLAEKGNRVSYTTVGACLCRFLPEIYYYEHCNLKVEY